MRVDAADVALANANAAAAAAASAAAAMPAGGAGRRGAGGGRPSTAAASLSPSRRLRPVACSSVLQRASSRAPGTPGACSAPRRCVERRPRLAEPQQAEEATRGDARLGDGHSVSMFRVPLEAMEEVLRLQLPIGLDSMQESFCGFDCDHSARHHALPAARLHAGRGRQLGGQRGGDAPRGADGGQVRRSRCCPTRRACTSATVSARLPRASRARARGVDLDVRTERRGACRSAGSSPPTAWHPSEPSSWRCARTFASSRAGCSTRSRGGAQALRQCAALAAELLESALEAVEERADEHAGNGSGASGAGGSADALRELREKYDSLLEEATYYKRQCEQLERENKRLSEAAKNVKKTKKQLAQQLLELTERLKKERRERAQMEMELTEAYSQTLREIVAQHDAQATSTAGRAAASGGGRWLKR